MKLIVYNLGKRSKVFRQLYHDISGGRWLWGIYNYINDYSTIPISYLKCRGISINEGGGPINFHLSWGGPVVGIYIFFFGFSLYKFIHKKKDK